MRWVGHVERMGEERGAYRVLVGKPEGKRPLGRPRLRWVDNIRMDLQEIFVVDTATGMLRIKLTNSSRRLKLHGKKQLPVYAVWNLPSHK